MGKLAQARINGILRKSINGLAGAAADEAPEEGIAVESASDKTESVSHENAHKKTVILIPDIMDLAATPTGLRVISFLEDIVQQRRNAGEQIIIVGATDALDLEDDTYMQGQSRLDIESEGSRFRAILLPLLHEGTSRRRASKRTKDPLRAMTDDEDNFDIDAHERRKGSLSINYRHIGHMVSQLYPDRSELNRFSPSSASIEYLRNRVLTQDEVQHIALTTIGLHSLQLSTGATKDGVLNEGHITAALYLLDKVYKSFKEPEFFSESERAKSPRDKNPSRGPRAWLKEAETKRKPSSPNQGEPENLSENESRLESRLASIRESANRYEKGLLSGIVPAKKIRTTFSDVHVAPETIEALKTLTSLSLQRPEAFKYGVLKSDNIPGLLLYGPPGTGKTLLAKAVAKESGATVLNVSGSDVNQMYVGVSEKIVKAIFSLARKLSPCVVFIDEADSIFAMRSQMRQRSGHRDTINQFLQEWDGIDDHNVFLMVATNRPFDLDDAVLRRLPRRLLVDLPTREDREAILRIHLKDEELDPSVSLSVLAEQTPFYSGSDLKNLAVAAALAAVREENENKERFADYQIPEKRVLTVKHFDKAKEEISASVNEDMRSLAAIRKFDEEFGSGNRRKKNAWGFVPMERGEGDARVRPAAGA
jgi:SpoVK/Ycf46/Vps4 family AAA+-type ATPase